MLRPAQQTAKVAAAWLREGRRVVAATLVEVEGSAPLQLGASMYVDEAGRIDGSVTGGCVEAAVAQEALAILGAGGEPPRLVRYGISDALAGTVGLMCGGTVHIHVLELAGDSRDVAVEALDALVADRPHAVATLLDGNGAGAKMLVTAGERRGSLGLPLLDVNAERESRGLLVQGRTSMRHFGADGSSLGNDLRVHVTVHAEAPRMLIFGAVDFSAALAQPARGLGYAVTIADPRPAFLDSSRFSDHAATVGAWPHAVFDGLELGPRDAVLVFSHDAKLDVPALQGALATGAGYIGALGSRRTTAERAERLREAGVSDADIARIFGPSGLDIGASTVEETAIAVLAEIIAHRSGRAGRPLREGEGSIRAREEPAPL